MKALHIRHAAIALIAGAGLIATPLYADMHTPKEMGKGTMGGAAMMGDMTQMSGMMHDMANMMMAAKTPEERNALMAEHMKTMQEGMTMMNGMSPGGMGGMKGDMPARHQMMEKRMEMMQSMMQMMMDRLPAAPTK